MQSQHPGAGEVFAAAQTRDDGIEDQRPADFDHIWTNARLATFDPRAKSPYGLLENHALAVRGEHIAAILPADAPAVRAFRGPVSDCGGKWITPGFIDCHTHLVWGGSRASEWEMRLAGVPDHRDMVLTKSEQEANRSMMICCSCWRSSSNICSPCG